MNRLADRVGFAIYFVVAGLVIAFVFLEFASWGGVVGWLHAVVSALVCGCTSMLLWAFCRALRSGFRQGEPPAPDGRMFRNSKER
jgi:cation transport ATPase